MMTAALVGLTTSIVSNQISASLVKNVVVDNIIDSAPSQGQPDFLIDFANGIYTVGSTSYALEQAISRPSLVSGGVLAVPQDGSAIIKLLGPFQNRILSRSFSIILTVSGLPVVGNHVWFWEFQNSDESAFFVMTLLNIAGWLDLRDVDANVNNELTSNPDTFGSGIHKFGVTRNGTAKPLTLAADGFIENFSNPGPVTTTAWTEAGLGGTFSAGCNFNSYNIISMSCIDPVDDDTLAALTA